MSGSSPKSISISGVETDITIGKELAAVAQKSKALASRDCFEQLEMYLHGRSHDRVCLLFGLLQTGKNTMLRQAIGRMTKEDLSRIAYIKARRTDNMAMMNRDLKKLFNAGFRYVFIDEVTLMEDFIDSAALFSDVFATMGMKIVLSGTDSLGFWLAMDEELYDRAKSIHTTFIPYREYSRLLGIDSIDEYIRYGGTLRAGELAFDDEDVNAQDASFRDDESTRRYIDTAICKNIQHSLACYESGGHFRHLYSLYEAGELTSAINRIIEDMNHRFLISVLTDDLLSHDLRLTAANLRKERDPEKRTEALDAIDTEAVTQRLMELLDIRNKEEQSIGITTAHIIEIKQYLTALELIVDCPIESADPGIEPVEHILFTQPGMRYCQAQALIHSLLKDEQFSALSEYDKTQITGRILEEVRGRMMEDIVLLETMKAADKDHRVFKLQFEAGEFDMVIYDQKENSCEIFEIKHSSKQVPFQYLKSPEDYIKTTAEQYMRDNQEEFLAQFLKKDALLAEYQMLSQDSDAPVYRMRAITDALQKSGAKAVNVTVQKDGVELTFKTSAESLKGLKSQYSTWYIAPSDRLQFRHLFGAGSDYSAEDIIRIAYGRSTLYEAPSAPAEDIEMQGMSL